MKKRIIISAVLILIVLILSCYMLFSEFPEYEYFLIFEIFSMLCFIIATTTLFNGILQSKTNNPAGLKKAYISIVSIATAGCVLYAPCAFISCYDEFIPEEHYIKNSDYIQQFFPITDVGEIKTHDDLYKGAILYSNYPGFSELSVCNRKGFKYYEMKFTKSMNPILNLRNTFNIIKNYYTSEQNNYIINEKKVCAYSDNDNLYGYINSYGKCIIISANNCQADFVSEYDFAKYVYEQFELSDSCITLEYFRDEPWYNIGYYIKALSEPYESTELKTEDCSVIAGKN